MLPIDRLTPLLKAFLNKTASLLLVLLLLISTGMTLTGCGEKNPTDAQPTAEVGTEPEIGEGEGDGSEGEAEGEEGKPAKPVKAKPLPTFEKLSELPSTTLTWQTKDGFLLTGHLYDLHQNEEKLKALKIEAAKPPVSADAEAPEPEDPPEPETDDEGNPIPVKPPVPPAPKHRYPLLVLVHGLGGSQKDWGTSIPTLVQAGYAVLAIDLRGHGTSIHHIPSNDPKQPDTLIWRYMAENQWHYLSSDLAQVLGAFAAPKTHPKETAPQVLDHPAVLMGAGLGANLSLIVANKYPSQVKAVVALSPLLSVKKLEPALSVLTLKAPAFFAANKADPDSYSATQTLFKLTQSEPKQLKLYPTVGSGTELLVSNADLLPTVQNWLIAQ